MCDISDTEIPHTEFLSDIDDENNSENSDLDSEHSEN